jgi:ACS family hexuronate transporter-like MFS transporter
MFLGFFEAGHWPCAVKTTQQLLSPRDRAMGNSVLQSGTSIGAIVTPLIMSAMLTARLESWRVPFQVVGAVGLSWVVLWFAFVRSGDLRLPTPEPGRAGPGWSIWKLVFSRRMLVVFFVVACINTSWQTLRAWLPKFLQEGRGYAETDMLHFNALFYVATDVGCLGAGFLTLWLARRGLEVHTARMRTFFGCAVAGALTCGLGLLSKGPGLLAVLLVIGAGLLGLFPVYHALTQDISAQHQGKVTGFASVGAWMLSGPAQSLFGWVIDRTGSFDLGLAVAGLLPLAAWGALAIFWKEPNV